MLRIFDKSRGAFLPNQHFSDGMNMGWRGKITRLWRWKRNWGDGVHGLTTRAIGWE